MGDLRNKRKKQEAEEALSAAEDRRANGFTVFHFDFNPKLTRRGMDLGQAIRHLLRVTATRISWWRCPVRGLAIRYRKLPRTSYSHDHGETYMLLDFCNLADEVAAKRVLVLNMLLGGIELYRGLPNADFDQQVSIIKGLLMAPPSVNREEWLKARAMLHRQTKPLLTTHQADLRCHLLGEHYRGPTGPVAFSVTPHLSPGPDPNSGLEL